MMTATAIFADNIGAYLDAGWSGVLPLPPRAKSTPPEGFTGSNGGWPSAANINQWRRTHADGNIALRLPRDVIGVDMDLYKEPGAREALETIVGPLPPTWCSTSRVDGSGIRFYRVPCPPTGTVWRDTPVPGVEIIQHHHRYAVVWPSLHPEGRTYLWVDETSGEIAERPPEIDELTELPWAAIAALTRTHDIGVARAPVPLTIPAGDMSVTVERRLVGAIANTKGDQGSRHAAAVRDVVALLRYAERGEPGVDQALRHLREAFVAAVGADRPGGSASAEHEFDNIVRSGTTLVASTEGRIPTKADRDYEASGAWLINPNPAQPPTAAGQADEPRLTGWEPADLRRVLAADYEPPRPAIALRTDGNALFYPSRVNALNGESGSGKSWVALAACAQELNAGRTALYVDLEDHEGSVCARLVMLGVDPDTIIERFIYVTPLLPFNADAQELICELVTATETTVAVIDSVGEAMALQAAKQNDDDDVVRWFRLLPRRIAALGPAVILVDHVPKKTDDTNLFAIGSQRKRAAIDGVAYQVDTVTAFSAQRAGKVNLTCAKDRNGTYAKGQIVAEVNVDPNGAQFLEIAAPAGRDATGRVTRPTTLMERISRYLERENEPVSERTMDTMVSGNSHGKRTALQVLVSEGYVTAEPGKFGPKNRPGIGYRSSRAFREGDELVHDFNTRPYASNTRPTRVQDASYPQKATRGHASSPHIHEGSVAASCGEESQTTNGRVTAAINPALHALFDADDEDDL